MTARPDTTAATAATGTPSRRRRAPAGVVVLLLVALAGVGTLLHGADRLGRATAESLIAQQVQRQTGTFAQPEVEVHGTSFLLQAVRGRYERVDITVRGLSSGALRIEELQAELSGVRLPLDDLLLRNPDVVVVERAASRALLDYGDLSSYLEFSGRPYVVRPAGEPEEVEITGTVQVFGRDHRVSVDAVLGADDGALAVSPTRVRTGSDLDRAAELLLGERFTFVVPLHPLPFGQQVTGVEATPAGIVARTEGEQILLRAR